MASAIWIVAAAAAAVTASATIDCSTQPGWVGTDMYIVGEQAEQWLKDNPGNGNYVSGWNISNPVTIKFGCEVNYFLIWGDKVYVRVVKMEVHSMLDMAWVQELQSGDTAEVTSPRWYYTWEKHVPGYVANGGPGPGEWDDYIAPGTLAGSYEWPIDQTIEDVNEARCDFYHQVFDAYWKWYWFHAGWFPESMCREHMGPEHVGEENGGLVTTLWTGYTGQQHSSFGAETQFKGVMIWNEHINVGGMKTDQYNAVRQFYLDTCADRRDGTAWNRPWVTDWSWSWHVQNVHRDSDHAPYCSWLKETGWNDTAWDQPAIISKYACLFIDGIQCDNDGNIYSIIFFEKGLKGSAKSLLDAAAHYTSRFWVSFNSLTGTLPQIMGSNPNLWDMDVWKNEFSGELPCLTSENITYLDISYNHFEQFPPCFFTEARGSIYMEHNSFRGTIDPAIGNMANANTVWLSYNMFSGTIPPEMCNLKSVFDLDFGGNRLEGTLPSACLNAASPEGGWGSATVVNAHHNRFNGPLPVISATGRGNPARGCLCGRACGYTEDSFATYAEWWYYIYYVAWWEAPWCTIGTFEFDHNFFGGEYNNEWDSVIALSAAQNGRLTLRADGNLLSGALPSKVEQWSFYEGDEHYSFVYALEDNLFRCEKDGRWPDWTLKVGNVNLGQCLPVAHPISVSPKEAILGQAGQLAVSGKDFVSRGQQRCKYVSTSTGTETIVAATRVNDDLIRCLVPVSIAEGTYRITVSNNADDWASSTLIEGFVSGSALEVSIVKPVVPSDADALSVTMVLSGVDAEDFDSGNFISGIASLLQVSPRDVVLGSRRLRDGRVLQSGYTVSFTVITKDAAQSVDEIATTLEDGDRVKTSLVGAGLTSVTGVTTDVAYARAETSVSSTTESELPIIWIAVGGAAVVVACCLCGFIGFIYRMEKKGQSYFKEELNDDAGGATPGGGQVIGRPGGEEDNNNV